MIPEEFTKRSPSKPQKRWVYVLLIALFVLADIAIAVLIYNRYYADSTETKTNPSDETAPAARLTQVSSSDAQLQSPTASETDDIQALVDSFMQARLDRDFEEVQPYVTTEFTAKYDQEVFAGDSSPSLDDYEITDIKYIGSNTYRILVQTTWKLNGDDAGSKDWMLIATEGKNGYRINDYSGE